MLMLSRVHGINLRRLTIRREENPLMVEIHFTESEYKDLVSQIMEQEKLVPE